MHEKRFFVTLGASKQFQMLIQSRFYMLFDKLFIERIENKRIGYEKLHSLIGVQLAESEFQMQISYRSSFFIEMQAEK